MRQTILAFIAMVSVSFHVMGADSAASHPALREELLKMRVADQVFRQPSNLAAVSGSGSGTDQALGRAKRSIASELRVSTRQGEPPAALRDAGLLQIEGL